jgi:hypothetical protein
MVNEERHGVNPLRGSARQSFASAKKCFFVWYDQKKIGLMDLPHLMDNAARCPQALGQAVLAHNSTSPNSNEDLSLIRMKGNDRVAFIGRRRNLRLLSNLAYR